MRKRLATDRADAKRLVRGVKPGRKRVDLLKTLRAAARTSAARAALADLPAADLPLLVLAIADQEGARSAGLDAGLQALASCDEGAATAARNALESLVAKPALDELARRAAQPGGGPLRSSPRLGIARADGRVRPRRVGSKAERA